LYSENYIVINVQTLSSLMITILQNFYLQKEEPNKSCLLALRSIILAQDSAMSETQKYGMPCFVYAKKALCYLWTDKKTSEPYILMVDGIFLPHPNLKIGDRKKMKVLRIDPSKDLPVKIIEDVLQMALTLKKSK